MKKYYSANLILTVLVSLIFTLSFQTFEAKAAWGDFDTSFGFQGVTFETITGYHPRSVAIQTDGKILVTGYRITPFGGKGFFLRRYLSNGNLDTAFGTNGGVIGPETNSINTDYQGEKIVVQTNGKIAVAGRANGYYAVWQFTASGKRDTTFGQSGLQNLTNFPVIGSEFAEMNIQSGKLLLSLPKDIGGTFRIALLRLNSSGTIDGTFGNAGESLTERYGKYHSGTLVETNGKITVSGYKFNDLSAKGLERKLANGQTDLSFFPTPSNSIGSLGTGLVKMSNSKYALRAINLGGNGSVTLVLDKFSSTGIFESSISPFNGFSGGCPDIFTNQNDGKVLVKTNGILFRFNAELDSSTMEINYCSNLIGLISELGTAAIQPDDKMVVAGVFNDYLMIVRLLPN